MKGKPRTLCMEYARNRIKLKDLKHKISMLLYAGRDYDIDLSDIRKSWFEEDNEWAGWVIALQAGDYTEKEMELAVLLDEKKEILRDAGVIKRKIYAVGISAINNKDN